MTLLDDHRLPRNIHISCDIALSDVLSNVGFTLTYNALTNVAMLSNPNRLELSGRKETF